MSDMSYTESEAYQKEIAEQYKERNLTLEPREVVDILSKLGFKVDEAAIAEAETGNMNATFITPDYVVKVSNDPESVSYSANKIVSEKLPDEKVVRVITHDVHQNSEYEVLVMERAPGSTWLTQMPAMSEEENKKLFAQVLQIVSACRVIHVTDKFGWVTDIMDDSEKNGFETFRSQLESRLDTYVQKIAKQEDIDEEAMTKVAAYARDRLHLFDNDVASFVHSDLHMGNVMQENGSVTAVIDWDSTQSAPSYRGLVSLIGLIDNPAQFVEGTPSYQAYRGKKFEYLYPVLKSAFTDELVDPKLAEKLNVLGVIDGLMWMSEDWSREWNKEMIKNLSTRETPTNGDVSNTYYGEILSTIKSY